MNVTYQKNYEKPTITPKSVIIVIMCVMLCCLIKSCVSYFSIINAQMHYDFYISYLEKKKNTEGFESLKNINSDFMAWLKIDDVSLSMPIVSTSSKNDEDFYLKHGFDKKTNILGCPYQSYQFNYKTENNSLINGHSSYTISTFGSTKQQSLFGKLNTYLTTQSNSYTYKLLFETENGIDVYTIIGYFKFKITNTSSSEYQEVYNKIYCANSLKTENEYNNFIECFKKYSIAPINIDSSFGDKFITLFTCSPNLDYRTIVVAKKI